MRERCYFTMARPFTISSAGDGPKGGRGETVVPIAIVFGIFGRWTMERNGWSATDHGAAFRAPAAAPPPTDF
jgi:hypothetical protein